MDALVHRLQEWVANGATTWELRLPSNSAALLARLHREARVHDVRYVEDEVRVIATLSNRLKEVLTEYLVAPAGEPPIDSTDSERDKMVAIR
ncbi:MAG: hypothetical protein ABI680_08650, partial [Chthoniobacteraceae bacterium]